MSDQNPERDKAAADLVRRLVTCGHRVLVLCYGCDTDPYIPAPHPCEEKRGGGGVWALRADEANQTLEPCWIENTEIDRIVLDLNRDLLVLQAGSFYDRPNVDYERIEKRVMAHYWEEEKVRLPRIGKEAGAAVVKKTGLAFHDIQKAVAEVAKRPHALAPDGNVIACDPPFKYKSQGAHAHSPPSDGFGGFLPPGDHGYVYVDREKYEAGKAACFNKALAPGMNHCKIGDAVRLRNGKCVGRIKEIQYTAPLQAVVELISGEPETYQLHNLELVNACVEVTDAAEVRDKVPPELAAGYDKYRSFVEDHMELYGRLPTEREMTARIQERELKPAGEMGETEPQECKLGKESDDEFPCSCTNVNMGHNPDTCELREHASTTRTLESKRKWATGPCPNCGLELFYSVDEGKCSCGHVVPKNPLIEESMDEKITARDAEESNRPALSSKKMEELYEIGTKIVVKFNLPQEPPCTCENVNLPHTPNCPWKKWKSKQK